MLPGLRQSAGLAVVAAPIHGSQSQGMPGESQAHLSTGSASPSMGCGAKMRGSIFAWAGREQISTGSAYVCCQSRKKNSPPAVYVCVWGGGAEIQGWGSRVHSGSSQMSASIVLVFVIPPKSHPGTSKHHQAGRKNDLERRGFEKHF